MTTLTYMIAGEITSLSMVEVPEYPLLPVFFGNVDPISILPDQFQGAHRRAFIAHPLRAPSFLSRAITIWAAIRPERIVDS